MASVIRILINSIDAYSWSCLHLFDSICMTQVNPSKWSSKCTYLWLSDSNMYVYIYIHIQYIYTRYVYIYIYLTSQSIVNLASESTSLPPWPGRCRVAKKRFCRYLDTIAVRLNGEPDHQAGELGCRLRRTWQFHRCADWGSIGWIAKSVCTYLFIYLSLCVYIYVCVYVCMYACMLTR